MLAVKVLEKKNVIRLFGLALILAPFVNMMFSAWAFQAPGSHFWGYEALSIAFTNSTNLPAKCLYVMSLLIGAVMLRGSASSWKFVLILLGGYIVMQLPNLGHNVRKDWLVGALFLVNVFVFFFIADQLVWKVHGAVKKKAAPAVKKSSSPSLALVGQPKKVAPPKLSPVRNTPKKILIRFEDFAPWAELSGVDKQGIFMRGLRDLPFELDQREIEINLKKNFSLRVHFEKKEGNEFFFKFTSLSKEEVRNLNTWLRQQTL